MTRDYLFVVIYVLVELYTIPVVHKIYQFPVTQYHQIDSL